MESNLVCRTFDEKRALWTCWLSHKPCSLSLSLSLWWLSCIATTRIVWAAGGQTRSSKATFLAVCRMLAGASWVEDEDFRSVCTTTFSDLFEKGSQPTSAEFALHVLDSLPLRENLVDCVQCTQCRILVRCEGERPFWDPQDTGRPPLWNRAWGGWLYVGYVLSTCFCGHVVVYYLSLPFRLVAALITGYDQQRVTARLCPSWHQTSPQERGRAGQPWLHVQTWNYQSFQRRGMTVPEVDAIRAGSVVVQLLVESPSPGEEQGCGEEQPSRQPQLLLSVAQWQLLLQLLRRQYWSAKRAEWLDCD